MRVLIFEKLFKLIGNNSEQLQKENQVKKSVKDIADAMENAAISGLCREGQLEIGVQEARKFHSDKDDQELYRLVGDLYDFSLEKF